MLQALDGIALELSVPDAAVAVAWLLAQRTVAAPIVNAFAPEHVEELVQGVGVQLSRAHLARAVPRGPVTMREARSGHAEIVS